MDRVKILEELEDLKKVKCNELLKLLKEKGLKKVGTTKQNTQSIKYLEENPQKIDFDVVIEVYQSLRRKEAELAEENKKKKMRDVELWSRAMREEEKLAVEKYAEETGEKQMEELRQQINEKRMKELEERKALLEAKAIFLVKLA